jgi:cyclophilin family peptidyl-prolyl cis-trans isomerase
MKSMLTPTQLHSRLRSPLAALLSAAAALPLLVACGGGGGGDTASPAVTVTSASAGTPRYSQQLLLTINGTLLDQPITVSSAGCSGITRSTTAPNISTATTAYYTCTVNSQGAQQFSVVRTADNVSLATAAYTVPVPQVTMTVSNGAAVSGSYVITLTPQQTPVTVNNFLSYVNAGYYNGTAIHRITTLATSGVNVLQGGGYAAPLLSNVRPTLKPTNASIVLEDNAGLSNLRLTMAMARTSVADSATAQFFINTTDNLVLDRTSSQRGYAVFGSVTSGADVVAAMYGAPCTASNLISECLPIPNLVVSSATQTR